LLLRHKQNYLLRMYLFCQNTLKTDKQIIFEQTELGKLHLCLPLKELSALLPDRKNKSGAPSWVKAEGMIAMLFLQSYTQLSDRKFIDHFNGNWQLQMFCGVQLALNESIKDRNLMSRLRSYVSQYLALDKFQTILLQAWKPYMENTHVCMGDATVYESHMRYPTDVKLLWECCEYLQQELETIHDKLGLKFSDKRYTRKKQAYLGYAKSRKKPYRLTRKMRKTLLNLTERLQQKLQGKLNVYAPQAKPVELVAVYEKLRLIKQIITQQRYLITHQGSKLSDRILSIHKPYVRAIVRGKEIKSVEFGAKAHILQVDGINYIEHLSYKAFNETTRLRTSIIKHKQLFGKCFQWSADAIYATNKNRKYTTALKITTNFVTKGRAKDDPSEKQMKALLNKERSTRLEGSFGTEKNYYGLAKVKARKESTERLCIYFAIMTANAVRMSRKIECAPHRQAA
jgi:IS5 family transposase